MPARPPWQFAPSDTVVTAAVVAMVAYAAPALSRVGALRRAWFPALAGVGRPGGVALTFDDGPHPLGTPAVLEALADLGWSATFFMLGSQVRRFPDVARSVAAAGHEIAIHGDEHRNHLVRTPFALARDLRRASEVVHQVTGSRPRWYRAPYGVMSTGTLYAARAAGLTPVLWTAWGEDWMPRSGEAITATVMRDLREGGTAVLHDSDCTGAPGSWRNTARSLPLLGARLRAHGWAVRTLSEHRPGPATC